MINKLEPNKYYSLGFQTVYRLNGRGIYELIDVYCKNSVMARWQWSGHTHRDFIKRFGDDIKELTEEEAFAILL